MKYKTNIGLIGALIFSASTHSAGINIDRDVEISGGLAGGSSFIQSPALTVIDPGVPGGKTQVPNAGEARQINSYLNDFIVDMKTGRDRPNELGAQLGVGTGNSAVNTLFFNPTQGGGVNNTGVQYGWFNYFLDKNSKIEFGHLITKIGYESLYSYQNPHILHSTMWRAQPTTYGGIRYSSEAGDISFYGEFTNGGGLRQAGAFGASGRAGNLDYVAQIYDEKDGIQIIEATITMKSGNLPISVNVNSISHDISLPGVDSKATGLALYTKTDISGLDTPIRVEYVKDGTSGIYAYTNLPIDKAWSITVTPTKNFDKKTYLRGEFSFINAENEVFTDTNGSSQKTNMFLGLQAGMKF